MKNKFQQGIYDLEWNNYAQVDPTVKHPLGQLSTILHETVHFQVTHRSPYGLLVTMLYKLGKKDKRLTDTAHYLLSKMKITQECIAVFYEMIWYYEKNGKEACFHHLRDMQLNNREYFDYLQPLFFLIHQHDDLSFSEKLEIANMLTQLALSGNIGKVSNALKPRLLENHFKNEYGIGSKALIPDVRFKLLSSAAQSILQNNEEFTVEALFNKAGLEHKLSKHEDVLELLHTTIENQPQKEDLLEILEGMQEINLSETYLWIHPNSFTSYKISAEIPPQKLVEVLICGSGAVVLPMLISPSTYTFMFMDNVTKTIYVGTVKKDTLIELFKRVNLPLTVHESSFKEITKNPNYFKVIEELNRPLYVYIDAPYVKARPILNQYLSDDSVCIMIAVPHVENVGLLVIKPKKNEEIFILQLFFYHHYNYIQKTIEQGELRASLLNISDHSIQDLFFQNGDNHYLDDYFTVIDSELQIDGEGDFEKMAKEHANFVRNNNLKEEIFKRYKDYMD